MLFTPENAQKIMAGLKTQTRQPEREGDYGVRMDDEGRLLLRHYLAVVSNIGQPNERLRWEVGKVYAVQPGRGKKSIGHIRLVSIRRERVNEISEADARAEGVEPFNAPGIGLIYKPAFATLWDSIYSGGMAFATGPMVWVLEFERV